jgi:hypothetical protein
LENPQKKFPMIGKIVRLFSNGWKTVGMGGFDYEQFISSGKW